MKAMQITELSGPATALELVDAPEPEATTVLTPDRGVVIDVHAAGVSFPELLQTRGEYQVKPPVPFTPGSEVAGIVRSAPPDAAVAPGDRVAAVCLLGGWAEVVAAPEFLTYPLPEALDFAQGAALHFNYQTAYFSMQFRGRLEAGETVLVHGAAGGVGTACLQVAKGLGARTIAVVSTDEKAAVARKAGADEVVYSDSAWAEAARELSDGGVHMVVDPVGGGRFESSLQALREGGRIIVVGFTAGSIPTVRLDDLLNRNIQVVGAGWGAYAMNKPDVNRRIGSEVNRLVEEGFVRPLVGARLPLQQAAEALALLDERKATGKIVLDVR